MIATSKPTRHAKEFFTQRTPALPIPAAQSRAHAGRPPPAPLTVSPRPRVPGCPRSPQSRGRPGRTARLRPGPHTTWGLQADLRPLTAAPFPLRPVPPPHAHTPYPRKPRRGANCEAGAAQGRAQPSRALLSSGSSRCRISQPRRPRPASPRRTARPGPAQQTPLLSSAQRRGRRRRHLLRPPPLPARPIPPRRPRGPVRPPRPAGPLSPRRA